MAHGRHTGEEPAVRHILHGDNRGGQRIQAAHAAKDSALSRKGEGFNDHAVHAIAVGLVEHRAKAYIYRLLPCRETGGELGDGQVGFGFFYKPVARLVHMNIPIVWPLEDMITAGGKRGVARVPLPLKGHAEGLG
jgi:hypothetical protein